MQACPVPSQGPCLRQARKPEGEQEKENGAWDPGTGRGSHAGPAEGGRATSQGEQVWLLIGAGKARRGLLPWSLQEEAVLATPQG